MRGTSSRSLSRVAVPAAIALALLATGCSRSEEAEPVETGSGELSPPPGETGGSTTGTATTDGTTGRTTGDGADVVAGPGQVLLRDPAGDTRAGDLDIVEATLRRRAQRLEATIVVSAAPKAGSIYSTVIQCRTQLWQLALVRANDGDIPFVAQVTGAQRSRARGSVSGTTVRVWAPSTRIPCTRGAFSFRFVAERTGRGARMTDAVPRDVPIPFRPAPE